MDFEINWDSQRIDFCKIVVENNEYLEMKIWNSRHTTIIEIRNVIQACYGRVPEF